MNEILAYIGNNRRRVSVGYKLPGGKVERTHRKIDGQDSAGIQAAIHHVMSLGVKEVYIEIYRPNGTAEKICKTFTLPNDGSVKPTARPMGNPSLFDNDEEVMPRRPFKNQPISQPQKSSSMDWRDYALKTENEKVSKLEAEVKRLTIKSESLDSRVRDFEKEMIKKDHELEKAQAQLTNKSALQGVAEQAMNNPQAMTILSGLASRILGLPDPQQPQLQQGALQGTGNAETDEFLANIGKWMVGQPIELQHQFYALIVELTKTKEGDPTAVSSRIINIINFLKNGTVLKRTA